MERATTEEEEHGHLAEQPRRKRRKRREEEEEGRGLSISMLPADLLLLVFARLTAADLIRAGSVCVSWRKALKTKGRLPPRTILPWLMPWPSSDEHCALVDPDAGKTYRIHLPELAGKRRVGTSDDGFLVYNDSPSNRLFMINPITKATVVFPPLPAPHLYFIGVFVVHTGTGYTVVVRGRPPRPLFLASIDAENLESWGSLSSILNDVCVSGFHACGKKLCGLFPQLEENDVVYRFFTCDLSNPAATDAKVCNFRLRRAIWSLDDFGGSFPDHHNRGECGDRCLENCCLTNHYPVVLPSGDLIVVCEALLERPPRTIAVKVYKMPADLHGEAAIITSIGNYALFLDGHGAIALSTLEYPELKPSTIYFADRYGLAGKIGVGWGPYIDLVVFDMEEARFFPIPVKNCDVFRISSWFVPVF